MSSNPSASTPDAGAGPPPGSASVLLRIGAIAAVVTACLVAYWSLDLLSLTAMVLLLAFMGVFTAWSVVLQLRSSKTGDTQGSR
ncbi:hypothetical protein [Actinotalea sp. C106]|uniref:hypothetical protein n=1 Tax=Actinotalea sp. C106 TaxID=2908644 RepID=UPI0020283C1A|nr:hypothetical protein [Actinotalea sp. C106]